MLDGAKRRFRVDVAPKNLRESVFIHHAMGPVVRYDAVHDQNGPWFVEKQIDGQNRIAHARELEKMPKVPAYVKVRLDVFFVQRQKSRDSFERKRFAVVVVVVVVVAADKRGKAI